MAGWINWAVLVDEEGEEGVKRRSEGENRTRGRERMRKHWRDKPTGAKLIWMCVTILPQSRIAFVFLVCVCAPWLEIAYVQIKDFPLLFSCRLRVVVDRQKRTFLSEKGTLRNKSSHKTSAEITDRCTPLRGQMCDTLKELPFKCSLSPDLYQCEQTHLNRAVSLIWCCSKDISKWIGPKIILFTSINRSILATSNQMRCSMCRSRDSALCLPTLQYRESTVHKFSWTKLFFCY